MDIRDYLIEQEGVDWPKLLSAFNSSLPNEFTLWMVNRIGDTFLVFEDESVHMLDVGAGRIARLAESRDKFSELVDLDRNFDGWFAAKLVDQCVAAGMKLAPGQCYGYKVPPILGGAYDVGNLVPTDLSVHYGFLGDIFNQIKDVPDGAKFRVVVGAPPPTGQDHS